MTSKMFMTILGIDPGSHRIGYGIIKKEKGLKLLDFGVIGIDRKKSNSQILENAQKLSQLIKKYQPDLVSIEKIYFSKNVKTGIEVAQTRGALILEISKCGLTIKEYSPSEIKLSVTGYGLADKKAVIKMVALTLGIKDNSLKGCDDAADALAAAITAANDIRLDSHYS